MHCYLILCEIFTILSCLIYNLQVKNKTFNLGTSLMHLHKIRLPSFSMVGLINKKCFINR